MYPFDPRVSIVRFDRKFMPVLLSTMDDKKVVLFAFFPSFFALDICDPS